MNDTEKAFMEEEVTVILYSLLEKGYVSRSIQDGKEVFTITDAGRIAYAEQTQEIKLHA